MIAYTYIWLLLLGGWLLQSGCTSEPADRPLPPTVAVSDHMEVVDTPTVPALRPIDYDTAVWTELTQLMPGIYLDIRYATPDNFVGKQMYECGRCFLRPETAEAVLSAQELLAPQGYGLMMLDCYRPRPVQQRLWEVMPDKRYVTPPSKGSRHNSGTAIDLTLTDNLGNALDMGTAYDYFGKEAWPSYTDLPEEVLARRRLLTATMKEVGLSGITSEWWHFANYRKRYPLADWEWPCPR